MERALHQGGRDTQDRLKTRTLPDIGRLRERFSHDASSQHSEPERTQVFWAIVHHGRMYRTPRFDVSFKKPDRCHEVNVYPGGICRLWSTTYCTSLHLGHPPSLATVMA